MCQTKIENRKKLYRKKKIPEKDIFLVNVTELRGRKYLIRLKCLVQTHHTRLFVIHLSHIEGLPLIEEKKETT